jgi:hypothetical protein
MKKSYRTRSPIVQDDINLQVANIILHIRKFLCGYQSWSDLRAAITRTLEEGGDCHDKK